MNFATQQDRVLAWMKGGTPSQLGPTSPFATSLEHWLRTGGWDAIEKVILDQSSPVSVSPEYREALGRHSDVATQKPDAAETKESIKPGDRVRFLRNGSGVHIRSGCLAVTGDVMEVELVFNSSLTVKREDGGTQIVTLAEVVKVANPSADDVAAPEETTIKPGDDVRFVTNSCGVRFDLDRYARPDDVFKISAVRGKYIDVINSSGCIQTGFISEVVLATPEPETKQETSLEADPGTEPKSETEPKAMSEDQDIKVGDVLEIINDFDCYEVWDADLKASRDSRPGDQVVVTTVDREDADLPYRCAKGDPDGSSYWVGKDDVRKVSGAPATTKLEDYSESDSTDSSGTSGSTATSKAIESAGPTGPCGTNEPATGSAGTTESARPIEIGDEIEWTVDATNSALTVVDGIVREARKGDIVVVTNIRIGDPRFCYGYLYNDVTFWAKRDEVRKRPVEVQISEAFAVGDAFEWIRDTTSRSQIIERGSRRDARKGDVATVHELNPFGYDGYVSYVSGEKWYVPLSDVRKIAKLPDGLVYIGTKDPVVAGTTITVSRIASLASHYPWTDIMKMHPELTDESIRCAVAYSQREAL